MVVWFFDGHCLVARNERKEVLMKEPVSAEMGVPLAHIFNVCPILSCQLLPSWSQQF